ncbi:hypothetical protein ACIA6C_15960 [Streptomyces sp. NPDC051578]|uniref:hypothetical protein n=1 Tax=Streptomyces sp. NPDC051578 TaxID=3365662 RepID=UPI003795F19D
MSRRSARVFTACTALLALAACPAASGTATAVPAPLSAHGAVAGLPPIGAEFPSSMLAANVPMMYKGQLSTFDFRGGIKQRVERDPDDPSNSVRLRTVGFSVSAELPSQGGGRVTFEQSEVDDNPQSTLRQTRNFPPQYQERDVIPVTAAFALPGESGVLHPKEPLVLSATLTQYPARGDVYTLEKPVDLVDPAHPNTVVARLLKFPAKRGGL